MDELKKLENIINSILNKIEKRIDYYKDSNSVPDTSTRIGLNEAYDIIHYHMEHMYGKYGRKNTTKDVKNANDVLEAILEKIDNRINEHRTNRTISNVISVFICDGLLEGKSFICEHMATDREIAYWERKIE